jgi:hypothetical protein
LRAPAIALPLLLALAAAVAAGPACRGRAPYEERPPSAATAPEQRSPAAAALLQRRLAVESAEIQAELRALVRRGRWRGGLDASEREALQRLLFRFVVNRSVFIDEFERRGGLALANAPAAERLRAHVLALHAGWSLADASGFLVAEFLGDPVAIAALNEPLEGAGISAGSYDALLWAVTESQRLERLAAAWHLHEQARERPRSGLAGLASEHPAFAPILAELPELHARAVAHALRARAYHARRAEDLVSPGPGGVAELADQATRRFGGAASAARALLFEDLARVRRPKLHPLVFSEGQKREIRQLLRSGDILLTRPAGDVSRVFVPGNFEHAITYVGDVRERADAGLETAPAAPRGPAPAHDLALDRLPDGARADLIEALAEGVVLGGLERLLDTRVERLLVLRPVLVDSERAAFLGRVFGFLGDPYDFRFDFADASQLACTEVVQRALEGKGGIHFGLARRLGRPTLGADDMIRFQRAHPERLRVILLAEENAVGEARIWVGEAGSRRLEEDLATDPAAPGLSAPAGRDR